jgi:hypothetical protein
MPLYSPVCFPFQATAYHDPIAFADRLLNEMITGKRAHHLLDHADVFILA